jgi:hypothetical protein
MISTIILLTIDFTGWKTHIKCDAISVIKTALHGV